MGRFTYPTTAIRRCPCSSLPHAGSHVEFSSSWFRVRNPFKRFGSTPGVTSGPRRKSAKVAGFSSNAGVVDFDAFRSNGASGTMPEVQTGLSQDKSLNRDKATSSDAWEIYNPLGNGQRSNSTGETQEVAPSTPRIEPHEDPIRTHANMGRGGLSGGEVRFVPIMRGGGVCASIVPAMSNAQDYPPSFRKLQWESQRSCSHERDRADGVGTACERDKSDRERNSVVGMCRGATLVHDKRGTGAVETFPSNKRDSHNVHHIVPSPSGEMQGGLLTEDSGVATAAPMLGSTPDAVSASFHELRREIKKDRGPICYSTQGSLAQPISEGVEEDGGPYDSSSGESEDKAPVNGGDQIPSDSDFSAHRAASRPSGESQDGPLTRASLGATAMIQKDAPGVMVGKQRDSTDATTREDGHENVQRDAAARIGNFLSKIPLSKLKIVIGKQWTCVGILSIVRGRLPAMYATA